VLEISESYDWWKWVCRGSKIGLCKEFNGLYRILLPGSRGMASALQGSQIHKPLCAKHIRPKEFAWSLWSQGLFTAPPVLQRRLAASTAAAFNDLNNRP